MTVIAGLVSCRSVGLESQTLSALPTEAAVSSLGAATTPPATAEESAAPSPGQIADWPGRTWTRAKVTEIDGEPLRKLFLPFAADGRFVAIAEGNVVGLWRLAYSDDGRTWHFARVPGSVCCEITPVAFGDGRWVAMTYVEEAGAYRTLTSDDGRTWNFLPGDPLVLGSGPAGSDDVFPHPIELTWHRGSWYVLVEDGAIGTPVLYRSDDGTGWVAAPGFPAAAGSSRRSMDSDGTTLVVSQPSKEGISMWWSADGVSWNEQPLLPRAAPPYFAAVEAAGGRWVAVSDWPSALAWWSADGRSWSGAQIEGDLDAMDLRSPIVLADGFLALNINANVPWASRDGRAWTPIDGFETKPRDSIDRAAETQGTTLITGFGSDGTPVVVWIGTSQ
jgi:hypothetical protein